MIDVQAADAPGLFAAPSGVSFGLLRPGTAETRTVELSDAGGGGGTWTVERAGPGRPGHGRACPPGGAQTLELSLSPPRAQLERQPLGQRRADLRDAHRAHPLVGLRRAPAPGQAALAAARGRALGQGRHARGHASSSSTTAGPPSPAGSGLPRLYPGREQLWSFTVPPGARNAGVVAEGGVVPQILLARDENRLAGEPALPSNGNPYLETYGRFERSAACSCRRRAATSSSSRRGPATGRARTGCASGSTIARRPRSARSRRSTVPLRGELRFHVSDRGSGVSAPDLVVQRGRHAGGRLGLLERRGARARRRPGGRAAPPRDHGLGPAGDEELRERVGARAAEYPHRAHGVHRGRDRLASSADGSVRVPGQAALRALRHPRLGGPRRAHARARRGPPPPSSAGPSSSRRRC